MSSLVAEPAGPADRSAALSRAARRGRGALLPLLVGAVATGLAWFRLLPGARNTLWAEDAAVFLTQRLHSGPLVSLVLPYDGYQQLVPRLLTDVATAAPVADYARTLTLLCCLVVGLAAAGAVVWTREALQHPAARVLFALVPVLTPVVAFEVLGNTANLHSFLLFLVPVLLLVRPSSTRGALLPALVAFVVAMSEIQALFFVPMLLLGVRHRRSWPIGGALLLGLTVQLCTAVLVPRVRVPVAQQPLDVVRGWFLEPLLSIVWPRVGPAVTRLVQVGPVLLVVLALAVVVAVVVALWGRWRRDDGLCTLRTLTVALVVASPLVWCVALAVNPTSRIDFTHHGVELLASAGYLRYAAVPSMFVLGVVVLAAERLLRVRRRAATAAGVVVLALLVGLLGWRALPGESARTGAPSWSAEYRAARRHCAEGATEYRFDQAPQGWNVTLGCATVRRGAFPTTER